MSRSLRVIDGPLSVICVALLCACAVESSAEDDDSGGAGGTGGSTTGGTGGATGGSGGNVGGAGGTTMTGGTGGAGGTGGSLGGAGGTGGTVGGGAGTGGSVAGQSSVGGAAGSGDVSSGAGGSAPAAGTGGAGGAPDGSGGGGAPGGSGGKGGAGGSPFGGNGGSGGTPPPLDCGPQGWAVENHGPPSNRVNYVILGDGYTATTVETTLVSHINEMLDRRFNHESGEPYARYRNFVNICVMKAISQSDGIGNGPTAFDGGNGGDRLAAVNESKVNAYINAQVPDSFEVDWKAVVLNQNKWENTGSILMLWSGAHGDAAGAALHEGGHGFHQLADEYCGKATGAACGSNTCSGSGTVHAEVNSAGNCSTTDNKWNMWLGVTQKGLKTPDNGATGVQGTFVGSRYVDSGQYRPSSNSMMNSLFGTNVNTSFNGVSREQIIWGIYRAVQPIDSTDPPAGATTNPAMLKVNVVDPAVINVDWTVDGQTTVNAGTTFNASTLAAGTHMISAKAYDNATTDLVKNRTGMCPSSVTGRYCHATGWQRSTQTVTWTVTKN
jgi:hypothetical protein